MAEIWTYGDKNREEMETRLLGLLKDDLAEKMDGYELFFGEERVDRNKLVVLLPELWEMVSVRATISWRYKKSSFASDWQRAPVAGIHAEFGRNRLDEYRANKRSYGYDFKNERLKPDAFQKLVAYLKGESETKIHQCKTAGQRKTAQRELLGQVTARLKSAGYAVKASQKGLSDDLSCKDISFRITRPNGKFTQHMEVLTSGQLAHSLGVVDLKDVTNFLGCLEQTLRYIK